MKHDRIDPESGVVRVMFKNSRGFRLAGDLLVPAGPGPHPVVVFAHGWGGDRKSPRNRVAARALVDAGIAAFLFDFTGHGESEGTEVDCTPAQCLDDLRSALDILDSFDEVDRRRSGVVGGGTAAGVVLQVAAQRPRLRAIALRSPDPVSTPDEVPALSVPVQLVVGEHDAVTRATSQRLLAALPGPKRLDVVDGGDGRFDDPRTRRQAAARLAGWFGWHLRRVS
jgi:dienelactone hydrolase